jgi:hypothetical protein
MLKNKMRNFRINVLIQLLVPSTCLVNHVIILRKTIFTCSVYMVSFHAFMEAV